MRARRDVLVAFLRLVRIEYSSYGAAGVVMAAAVAGDLIPLRFELCLAAIVVFLVALGCYALDDYYDLEADRFNHRNDRPLVTGLLTPRTALATGVLSFAAAIVLIPLLQSTAAIIIASSLPLTFVYNLHLKRVFLLKNAVIAGAFVAPLLVGALATDGTIEPIIAYGVAVMFIVGFAFEVMIDIPDIGGDRLLGVSTIATKYGSHAAARVATVLFLVVMVMDPLPFALPIDPRFRNNWLFLALIAGPAISYLLLSRSLLRNPSGGNVAVLKKRVFLVWQLGSLAYLAGALL